MTHQRIASGSPWAVKGLIDPAMLVEIEALAVLPAAPAT